MGGSMHVIDKKWFKSRTIPIATGKTASKLDKKMVLQLLFW